MLNLQFNIYINMYTWDRVQSMVEYFFFLILASCAVFETFTTKICVFKDFDRNRLYTKFVIKVLL